MGGRKSRREAHMDMFLSMYVTRVVSYHIRRYQG